MNNSKNGCEGFSFFRISYELGGHFITPSGVSWTPLGAFYELFTFHLAFYIIWWTSGGGYCNFVADHQTNFWRCNLWNYQETANVYQQVLIVKKVNLMIYQPSLSLYIFLVLYDLVVRFIKFWKSKITLWMKQYLMNKPPANDVACRIIVAHHNHLKWLETLFDAKWGPWWKYHLSFC